MVKSSSGGTSVFQNGLLWFGAAVSIAEIEAGTQLASSAGAGGPGPAIAAILLGHLVGGALLFLSGLVGAQARRGAMDAAKIPFGRGGAGFFAVANLAQLLGWTSVMVAQGAAAAATLLPAVPFPALCIAIGALVAVWIFIGLENASRINRVAMALLFALTLFLCLRIFGGSPAAAAAPGSPYGGFWSALELSVAMPLSWLPLVADYTKDARRPVAASACSAGVYTLVSCWMYAIGLGVAVLTGEAAFAKSVLAAGVGLAGIPVVVFSTVTTTFLDAYSAGESARSLCGRLPAKGAGVVVCALGTLMATFGVMDHYADFLYLVASVFAPMAAVQLMDWFVLHRRSAAAPRRPAANLAAWLAGFLVYHVACGPSSPLAALVPALAERLGRLASPVGATLPAMLAAALASLSALPPRSGRK